MLKAMLQRLAMRGVLALLLVLSGTYVVPSVSARTTYAVRVLRQRSERRLAAYFLESASPAGRRPSAPASASPVTNAKCRMVERLPFQRPPPVSLARPAAA